MDILWVVDGSQSMASVQTLLADVGRLHIRALEGEAVAYQLGVILPDLSDPAGPVLRGDPWIVTPETPDPEGAFAANLKVGAGAAGVNQGFGAAISALSAPLEGDENRGFNRADAPLEIVFVSDGDDDTEDPLTGGELAVSTALERLRALNGGDPVRVSAIVGPPPDGCSVPGTNAGFGERYIALADASGGAFVSICDVALTVVSAATDVEPPMAAFSLSQTPSIPEISVWVDEAPVGAEAYVLSGERLTFQAGHIPDYGALIRVSYVYRLEDAS